MNHLDKKQAIDLRVKELFGLFGKNYFPFRGFRVFIKDGFIIIRHPHFPVFISEKSLIDLIGFELDQENQKVIAVYIVALDISYKLRKSKLKKRWYYFDNFRGTMGDSYINFINAIRAFSTDVPIIEGSRENIIEVAKTLDIRAEKLFQIINQSIKRREKFLVRIYYLIITLLIIYFLYDSWLKDSN